MTYRIKNNGYNKYYVEIKGWFFWSELVRYMPYPRRALHDTVEEAEEAVIRYKDKEALKDTIVKCGTTNLPPRPRPKAPPRVEFSYSIKKTTLQKYCNHKSISTINIPNANKEEYGRDRVLEYHRSILGFGLLDPRSSNEIHTKDNRHMVLQQLCCR